MKIGTAFSESNMKIGDLVRRTYGEGQRPAGIVVGWTNARETVARVRWTAGDTYEMSIDYLEVISGTTSS